MQISKSLLKLIRGTLLLVLSLVIYILQTPLAFAKYASGKKNFTLPIDSLKSLNPVSADNENAATSVYDSLQLDLKGLNRQAFEFAKKGFKKLAAQGRLTNDSIISIIDFSQPSYKKRLYVLDIKNYKVLFHTWVAHGRNSGREWAQNFSNAHSSYKSSPGFFITGAGYHGINGYSLKLIGIEKGINNNAYDRGIVIHGADYVSSGLIQAQGYIGRSEGCPAVPVEKAAPIIKKIKDGSCLFVYNTSSAYLRHSSILN
jgi:hypothetical protein